MISNYFAIKAIIAIIGLLITGICIIVAIIYDYFKK